MADDVNVDNFRPVMTFHLPVPLGMFVEMQQVWLDHYPELGDLPMAQVMRTSEDEVVFLAPEPPAGSHVAGTS